MGRPFFGSATPESKLVAEGFPTLLDAALWYIGVKDAPGVFAGAFMGVMPVSALVLSSWLLGEPFHWQHAVGNVLVLVTIGCIVWANHVGRRRSDDDETDSGERPGAHDDTPRPAGPE